MPEIMHQLSLLCIKMHAERLDVLKDNEDYVAKDGKEDWGDSDDDDEDAIDNGNSG